MLVTQVLIKNIRKCPGGNSVALNAFFCGRKLLFWRIYIGFHWFINFTGCYSFLGLFDQAWFSQPNISEGKISSTRWVPSSRYTNSQCVIFYQRWNIYIPKFFTSGDKSITKISAITYSLIMRSLGQIEPASVCATAVYTYDECVQWTSPFVIMTNLCHYFSIVFVSSLLLPVFFLYLVACISLKFQIIWFQTWNSGFLTILNCAIDTK